jgi:hypothetical protein
MQAQPGAASCQHLQAGLPSQQLRSGIVNEDCVAEGNSKHL